MKEESLDSTNTTIDVEQIQLFDKGVLDGSTNLASQDGTGDAERSGIRCSFCGTKVDPKDKSTYAEIRSYVHGEKKDSAVLRNYTGRYAHEACVNNLKSGIAPDQPNLNSAMDSSIEQPEDQDLPTDQSESYIKGYKDGFEDTYNNDPALSGNQRIDPEEYETGYIAGETARNSRLSIIPTEDQCQ
jgi:hypothetical protein